MPETFFEWEKPSFKEITTMDLDDVGEECDNLFSFGVKEIL